VRERERRETWGWEAGISATVRVRERSSVRQREGEEQRAATSERESAGSQLGWVCGCACVKKKKKKERILRKLEAWNWRCVALCEKNLGFFFFTKLEGGAGWVPAPF
jgi:hypothetical protein